MTILLVQVLRDVRGDSDVAIEYLIAEASGDNSSSGSYDSDPDSLTATGTYLSYFDDMTHLPQVLKLILVAAVTATEMLVRVK